MVKKVIDWLFVDEKAVHKTWEWYEKIKKNRKDYENCFVVSFTRVKDLDSKWKHEYVQFIVEDESQEEDEEQNNRTRVYAERGNERDLDWVTVGVNDKNGDTCRKDLPLPLTSLFFDKSTRPRLEQLAMLLDKTTETGGPYNLRGHNCFWFAETMYNAVRGIKDIKWKEKHWNEINIGGKGGGKLRDLFGLVWPTLFKLHFIPTAEMFKQQRENHTNVSLDPFRRNFVTPKGYMDQIEEAVLDQEGLSAYMEILKENGISLDEDTLKTLLKEAIQNADKESQQEELDWNKNFDDDVNEFVQTVFADPDATKLLELYNKVEGQNALVSPMDKESADTDNKKQGEKEYRVEQASKIFAAKILVNTGLQTLE